MNPDTLTARLAARCAARNEHWTAAHTALCEIPAPPHGEAPRGEYFAAQLAAVGLVDVATDEVGNVVGRYAGSGDGPRLAVSAHLDTVFGPEVDCTVTREGDVLRGPGIGDDGAGLILLLALADGLAAERVTLPGELWLVATVGEENVGNLRGARKLAADGVAGRPLDAFLTLDSGTPGHVIRHGTHSHNLDITLRGPGGHAWGDFGVVNPAVAAARVVAAVSQTPLPQSPRTTFNCGILDAGFAPNAIPERARLHLNLRSESGAELARLVGAAETALRQAVESVNAARHQGPELTVECQVTSRPGGETPRDSRLVQAATAAASALGHPVTHPCSSTDANAFMAVGIDAVCLYRGRGEGVHTPDEWYDAASRPVALEQLADTVLRYFHG